MQREFKICLVLILILGMGLIYVAHEDNSLRQRVDEIDYLVIETGIRVDNGTHVEQHTVHLTRGATAYEALERVKSVGTERYPGMGEYVTRIDGVSNDQEEGKFWLVARKENGSWLGLDVGANSYRLKNGDNILFWYGSPADAPFQIPQ